MAVQDGILPSSSTAAATVAAAAARYDMLATDLSESLAEPPAAAAAGGQQHRRQQQQQQQPPPQQPCTVKCPATQQKAAEVGRTICRHVPTVTANKYFSIMQLSEHCPKTHVARQDGLTV
jgi:hypothetical protein